MCPPPASAGARRENMAQEGIKQMRKSTTVGLGGVLLIGLAAVGGCVGQVDKPISAHSAASTSGSDWQFWNYTSGLPSFNPNGTCTNNCSGCSGCSNVCGGSCTYYHNCPNGSYDLDWSGSGTYWGYQGYGTSASGKGIVYLPCDAMYDPDTFVAECNNYWQAHFHCVGGPNDGKHFLFNHLQHKDNVSNGWLKVGEVYNSGTPVGYEGGVNPNEGGGTWCSTGTHMCMETLMSEGSAPCNLFPPGWDDASAGGCTQHQADGPNLPTGVVGQVCASTCIPNSTADVCGQNSRLGSTACGNTTWHNSCGQLVDCGACVTSPTIKCVNGVCVDPPACTPNCSGKTCGPNGCGGSCGTCASGWACSSSGTCQPPSPTCPTGSYWYGAGQYCWDQPGMANTAANHLYNCPSPSGAAQDWGACGEGCHHMPNGQNDICYNGSCSAWSPYWVWACGWDSVANGNPIINYDCKYGTKISYQWCAHSCNWGSVNDYCQ
jgi:hypothetical protein